MPAEVDFESEIKGAATDRVTQLLTVPKLRLVDPRVAVRAA